MTTSRPEQPHNKSQQVEMSLHVEMDPLTNTSAESSSTNTFHNNNNNITMDDPPHNHRGPSCTPPSSATTSNNSEIARLFQACNNEGREVVVSVLDPEVPSAWEVLLEWIVDKKTAGFHTKLKQLVTYQDPAQRRSFLHIVCVHQAPLPVLETLLELAEDAYTSVRIIQDCHGMTPLHLACQYGVSVEHIRLVATGFTLTMHDEWGRTPLHVVMEHAMNPEAAGMVQYLLTHSSTLNATEQRFIRNKRGKLPLECLPHIRLHHLERHVLDCFDVYIRVLNDTNNHHQFYNQAMDISPTTAANSTSIMSETIHYNIRHGQADPDLFPVLGELPLFVQDHAAQHAMIQHMVNQRFCDSDMTFLFLLRLVSRLVMVIAFQLYWRHKTDTDTNVMWQLAFIFLLLSTGTLLVTNLFVLVVRISKGSCFAQWQSRPFDLVNAMLITGVLLFAILTYPTSGMVLTSESFRILSIVGAFIILLAWSGILLSFRLISKDFSSLVDGLWSVGRKITSFMMVLTIVIFAFAQMFYLTTLELTTQEDGVQQVTCPATDSPFCTSFSNSLLTIYAMTVGEVDILGDVPSSSSTATEKTVFVTVLYVAFIYITVLLLAQILAFIIGNDIWRSGHNSDLYFWSNRIRFLGDMEALTRVCCCFCTSDEVPEKSWQALSSIFCDHQLSALSPSFWFIMILRLNVLTVMVVWGIVGSITLGFAWPPQLRKYLFWAPIKDKAAPVAAAAAAAATSVIDSTMAKSFMLSERGVGRTGSSDQEDFLLVKADVNQLGDRIMSLETKVDKILALLEREWFNDEGSVISMRDHQYRGSRRPSMESMASLREHTYHSRRSSLGSFGGSDRW